MTGARSHFCQVKSKNRAALLPLAFPFSLFKGGSLRSKEIKGIYTYFRAHRKNTFLRFAAIDSLFIFFFTDTLHSFSERKNCLLFFDEINITSFVN